MCMNLNQYTADCESICKNLETIGLPYCDSFRFILSIGKCTFAIPSPCAWKLAFHLWESVCHLSPDWAVTRLQQPNIQKILLSREKSGCLYWTKLLNFCGVSFKLWFWGCCSETFGVGFIFWAARLHHLKSVKWRFFPSNKAHNRCVCQLKISFCTYNFLRIRRCANDHEHEWTCAKLHYVINIDTCK